MKMNSLRHTCNLGYPTLATHACYVSIQMGFSTQNGLRSFSAITTYSFDRVLEKLIGKQGLLKDTSKLIRVTEKLAMDDVFYPNNGSIQQLVDHATTAKNIHGTKGGISPYAWVTGTHRRHPLIDSELVPPVTNPTGVSDPFAAHLQHELKAAERFIREDARSILKLAKEARARRLIHITPGDVVYYWRASSDSRGGSYHGPARAVAVEPPAHSEINSSGVV